MAMMLLAYKPEREFSLGRAIICALVPLLAMTSAGCASVLGSDELRDEDSCVAADASVVRDLHIHLRSLPIQAWSELRLLDPDKAAALALGVIDVTSSDTSELVLKSAIPTGLVPELEWFVDYNANKLFDADVDLLVRKQICPDGNVFVSTNSNLPPLAERAVIVGSTLQVTLLFDAGFTAEQIDLRGTDIETNQQVALYHISRFEGSPLIVSVPYVFQGDQTYRIDALIWTDMAVQPEAAAEALVTMASGYQTLTLDLRALD